MGVLADVEPPKLFGRWSTTRSYGPYGKSYASSSVDSDFESDSQSVDSQSIDSQSFRSDLPDEYWPYSDADYSDTETLTSDFEENYSDDDLTSIASSQDLNEVEIEVNNGTVDTWIDDDLHPASKKQVCFHIFSEIISILAILYSDQKISDSHR